MKKLVLIFILWIIPASSFSQLIKGLELVGPVTEGYIPVMKDNLWGFINPQGELVIGFRDDLIYNEHPVKTSDVGVNSLKFPVLLENRAIIQQVNSGISSYGFIDSTGMIIIEPQFLNVSNFHKGYALALQVEEKFLEENDILEVQFQYNYNIVLIDINGEVVRCLSGPYLIQYPDEIKNGGPTIDVVWMEEVGLVAVKSPHDKWIIYDINK